jgi:hypothetical protein
MWRLAIGRHHVCYTVHAVPRLYIGGPSQITIIIPLWSGGRGEYRVYHRSSPFLSPLTPSAHIYREFGMHQINTVSTESVLLADALILALALSTSRSAHQ